MLLFVVLAAMTARSIWIAWLARSGDARAEAVFDLVGQRTALRPTDAPGAMAWLRLELDRYARRLAPDRARLYRSVATGGDRVPVELGHLVPLMSFAPPPDADGQRVRFGDAAAAANDALRRQRLVEFDGQTLVVTRRRALDEHGAGSASDAFVRAVVPSLVRAQAGIAAAIGRQSLPAIPGQRPPRPVRAYAVSEDGTLVSAPWDDSGEPGRAAAVELALLGARPGVPTFAPEEFFFGDQAAYSGFYLDLGGRGLVSTLLSPFVIGSDLSAGSGRGRQRGVIALDLAFDVDWRDLAGSVDRPVVGAAVALAGSTTSPGPGGRTFSWAALEGGLAADAPASLRAAVADLAAGDQPVGLPLNPAPWRHGIVDGRGAVAAFQVSDAVWLLMFFPKAAPSFPVAAVTLLAGVLTLLLAGFEFNRRRADGERRSAEAALAEKQNLLNTMQIPLVVVDPNTDVIVSSNRAAETIGVRAGQRFADLVWPDDRARRHYQQMQVASPEPRRAYGVPVGVRNGEGILVERYAIVRSVAVTAPIAALAADERHRLGVLFLLDPEADVALLADDLTTRAHRDERRRLAGLLSHGVDTLARVLDHCLNRPAGDPNGQEFAAWLAEYLERRITVAAWLLEHWDAVPPLPQESVIDRAHVDATLERFDRILRHVRADRELRARLHWNNGTLAEAAPDGRTLEVNVDWPASFSCTCPVRGGFGWFFGEVIANAVRHGVPGTVPRVTIDCDRVRRELTCRIENVSRHDPAASTEGDTYGGVSILRALGHLFQWRNLTFSRAGRAFIVSWSLPVSERGGEGQPD